MNAKPSRAERFRPAELVGLALTVALFTGIVVLFTTRDLTLAAVFLGFAFVVALVGLAMLALVTEEPTRLPGHDRSGPPDGSA